MRYPLIVGNWKLNGSIKIIKRFILNLRNKLNYITNCNIAIAFPALYLMQAKHDLIGSNIALGAQDVSVNLNGAFTGDISAKMLKDVGVKYIIIGHSERRMYHNESDDFISNKFAILKSQDLIPILCIGESKEENILGKTKQICINQINVILNNLGVNVFKNSVIAYEPIWAIGSSQSAIPKQIQKIHKIIRNHIAKQDINISKQVIIQYGGSVNPINAINFLNQPDIDGVLVGNSSLNVDSFISIINAALLAKKKY